MNKVYCEADIRNDYKKLTNLLKERRLTITTMNYPHCPMKKN